MQLAFLVALEHGSSAPLTAHASTGRVRFCINTPPQVSVPCNTTASQNASYFCALNATDVDGNSVTVSPRFTSGLELFSVSQNGTINFTPSNDHVGSHTIIFYATDNSGCDNNVTNTTFVLEVANINDPPYLLQDLPDQEFPANTTLSPFFLSDYFADPDGDALEFSVSDATSVTITILPSSEVRISASACGTDESVIFTATDPSGASAESNLVEIEATCDEAGGGTGGGDAGSGGGGGGGGAVLCTPEWVCQEWFACLPSGEQWRRCYDAHGCEPEKYLTRSCEYDGELPACEENWLCGEWGHCLPNGTQYRGCEDLGACGTALVKPATEQRCAYIATCMDGIRNGDETGVDCGGSCPACSVIEQPTQVGGQRLALWMLVMLALAVLLVSGVLRYYHAEIARLAATLGFLLRHRAYKDVLLDAAQRRSLFERIRGFEMALGERPDAERVYDELATLLRSYYSDALGTPLEALPEEIEARCKELRLRPDTTQLMLLLFAKVRLLEQEELSYDRLFVLASAEELRTLVCLTSDFRQEEIVRAIEEMRITGDMSFYDELFARAINLLRAVQFDQADIARKEYFAILKVYEPLSKEDQEQVYPELRWLFEAAKLQSEATGIRVVRKPMPS